ncbi:helix-turn-helix transcriptional regulator [Spirosoma arcticum]
MSPVSLSPTILYSCLDTRQRNYEQFVPEHVLVYLIAGESHFQTPEGPHVYLPGTIGLVRRHQLVKSHKVPPAGGGPFKAINIILTQELLRGYSVGHHLAADGPYRGPGTWQMPPDPFLKAYFDSLLPYFDQPSQLTPALAALKTHEAVALLLRLEAGLKNFLFDFNEPHKIDLVGFMEQNFSYNVPLAQFARLTGRSLATFKRDFQRAYGLAPQRWLHEKRLTQAHFLIAQQLQAPAVVCLEVGFENLSHFSTSFKQQFGYTASSLVHRRAAA